MGEESGLRPGRYREGLQWLNWVLTTGCVWPRVRPSPGPWLIHVEGFTPTRVSAGTNSQFPNPNRGCWFPPDGHRPLPRNVAPATANQPRPWAAPQGPMDTPGCPSVHVLLGSRWPYSPRSPAAAGASAKGCLGAGVSAATQLALQHRTLAWRGPGLPPVLRAALFCSCFWNQFTHPRRASPAAGLGLHVHIRGGVWLPPRLPQTRTPPCLNSHADPTGWQLRPGPTPGPWPPGHR